MLESFPDCKVAETLECITEKYYGVSCSRLFEKRASNFSWNDYNAGK
jgi:hypothetical protein